MTIFSDLCHDYDVWRTRYFDNQTKSVRLVQQIAGGFRRHIGAPESFKEPMDDPNGKAKPYVQPMIATDAGDAMVSFQEPKGFFDVITRWDDGYYYFGLGVAAEVAPNVWPKQRFCVPISFIIDDDNCTMRVTNRPEGQFHFNIGELDGCDKMYDFIASIVFDIFRTKPSDFAKGKIAMGFVPLKTEAQARAERNPDRVGRKNFYAPMDGDEFDGEP
jgi:hypothetical protein